MSAMLTDNKASIITKKTMVISKFVFDGYIQDKRSPCMFDDAHTVCWVTFADSIKPRGGTRCTKSLELLDFLNTWSARQPPR